MSKIVRYQFMGSWIWFWLICLTVIGFPLAVLYLLNGTIRVDSEVEDPEDFVAQYCSGKLVAK